jgi:hypothetical protein
MAADAGRDAVEDALGRALLARLDRALTRGPAPPALLVVRPDAIWFVDLRSVLAARLDPHRFMASFAGMPGTEVVGAIGGMRRSDRGADATEAAGAPVPVAGVFLEWADGRWWSAWRDLGEDGRALATDTDQVQRARDGLSRPGGLGGWFARARFEGLCAQLDPEPRLPEPALEN